MDTEEHEAAVLFSQRLAAWRKFKLLQKETLAHSADVTRLYVSDIEQGKRNPSLIIMLKLARGLDISLSELINGPFGPLSKPKRKILIKT